MSPFRLIASLLVSSRHQICGQATRSARLLHHRLPHGRRRAMAAAAGALSAMALVGVGGMSLYNFKGDDDYDEDYDDDDDEEKSVVARNPVRRHPEALEEDETMEEKAMKKRFEEWMVKYDRRYKDEEEKALRYEIFKHTAQRVDELNSRPGGLCTFDTNNFADKTVKECC